MPQRKTGAPHDSFNLVFFICLILGCGTLLSYNALVSCATYFNYQFYDYPNVMFIIVPIYSIPNLFFTILMIPFGDRLPWTFKILGSFIIVGILILIIPFLVSSNHNIFNLTQNESYHVFLFLIAIIGAANAIIQCSVFGFCGLLPTKYLQTLLSGQAVSGIAVCIIRIFSKLFISVTPHGIEESGMIYFILSALISIVCAISFYWSKHSAFVQHHIKDHIDAPKLKQITIHGSPTHNRLQCDNNQNNTGPLIDYHIDITSPIQRQMKGITSPNNRMSYDTKLITSPHGTQHIQVMDIQQITMPVLVRQDTPHTLASFVKAGRDHLDSPYSISFIDDDDILRPLHDTVNTNIKSYGTVPQYLDDVSLSEHQYENVRVKQKDLFTFESKTEVRELNDDRKRLPRYYVKRHRFNRIKYVRVFHNIRYLVLSIWITMFITFLWFPALLTNIPSSFHVINNNGKWMPIILITEYNVFDYIGRQFLSNYTPNWLRDNNLWICSLLRIATYPIFVAFYKGYIVNDYILHCVMIVSALGNGWISSLSFMWFPKNVNKHQQEIAASIMTLGCMTGILTGSCVALLIQPYM